MREKRIIKYFSMLFVASICSALIYKEQYFIASAIAVLFLGLAFGMDKIKVTKEGIEVEDNKP